MNISPFSMSLLMSSAGVFTPRNDKVRFSKYGTGKNCPKNFCLFVCSSAQHEAGHDEEGDEIVV